MTSSATGNTFNSLFKYNTNQYSYCSIVYCIIQSLLNETKDESSKLVAQYGIHVQEDALAIETQLIAPHLDWKQFQLIFQLQLNGLILKIIKLIISRHSRKSIIQSASIVTVQFQPASRFGTFGSFQKFYTWRRVEQF